MKKIRLMLEYKSYPIWIYDEDGFVEDNALPEEWKHSTELMSLAEEVQTIFNGLYLDTANEFRYQGFSSDEERLCFINKVQQLNMLILEINQGNYDIVNDIDLSRV